MTTGPQSMKSSGKVNPMPSPEVVRKAIAAIKRLADFEYFFDNLNSPDWIKPLWEAGLFSSPYELEFTNEGKYVRFPIWPPSRYLVRMADKAPHLVKDVALRIPPTENVRVHEDLIEAANKMPADLAIDFVAKAKAWLESPYHLLLSEKLGELLSHLARGGQIEAALELAKSLLDLQPDPTSKKQGEESETYRLSPKPRAWFSEWEYKEILNKNMRDLVDVAGIRALALLCDLLESVIRLSRCSPEDQGPEDYTYISRPVIEAHDEDHHEDLEDLLITAVRDSAEQIASSGPDKVRNIIHSLEQKSWKVFQRLALHTMRLYPDTVMDLIASRLTNRDLFIDSVHEYHLLLRDLFGSIGAASQNVILSWIEAGPEDAEERAESWEREFGNRPSAEDIERYRKSWQLKKLALIHSVVPELWKARYQALIGELGEPEPPDLPHRSVTWVGPTSPKSADALSQLSIEELQKFLKEWQPVKDQMGFGPSPEGLGRQISAMVACEPARYAEYTSRLHKIDPTYVRSFLQGFRDALGQQKTFPWAPIIDLCRWVVEQPRSIEGRVVSKWDADPDWGWTRKAVASLLSNGFQDGPLSIPFELRQNIIATLLPLTKDPDPAPEDEVETDNTKFDPSHLSINSTRGEAMHSVVRYARWVRQHIEKLPNEGKERVARGFDEMPEVRTVLDTHLETERDPSLAIRSVYGQWFPTLVWLDINWAEQNAFRIFPSDESLRKYRDAAWNTYIIFCHPYHNVFEVLKDQYQLAIEQIESSLHDKHRLADQNERLAEHLMVFYWQGVLDLEGSYHLLAKFYAKASSKLCGHALEFVGRSLRNTEEPAPPEVLVRIQNLWEQRFYIARQAPTVHSAELAEFGGLFASGHFEDTWAMTQLLEVLKLIGKAEPGHSVVERLAVLSEKMPYQTVECLRLLFEGDMEGWGYLSWRGHSKTILANAIHSKDVEAQQIAKEFINWLAARGNNEFHDLISKDTPKLSGSHTDPSR